MAQLYSGQSFLNDFSEIDSLEFNLNKLNNGQEIKETLINENACWHKTFKVKYKAQLVRANELVFFSAEDEISKKITCYSTNNSSLVSKERKLKCVFFNVF